MTDLDLELDAIAAGDASAFGRWVAGAEHEIRLRLRSFAESVDTEVICQETLLRMWQVAPRVTRDGKGNSLLRLALRTAQNLAIDEVRRLRRKPVSMPLDETLDGDLGDVSSSPIDPLVQEAVAGCRDKLPAKPRAAMGARFDDGGARHDRELAARLGMTLNTFLKNIGRARKLLIECLERRGVRESDYLGDRA
ncbi:RNA polymerase sigma factor [Planctomycetes bacterium Poly30]|uniref:RNA polymerase sigma factor n=1 Tax=Saltatorellus ferox TaxID=2528018 RepID=A0A518EMR1_9BACT|nr:RNA polymerase sigma factor [Planctomycetes bacterium Poly30]